jgi:hypothetical protein
VVDALPFFLDADQLLARARRHAREYQTAKPFPHIVLDDFLPVDVARACADEFPGAEEIKWDLYTDNGRTLKLATDDEAAMPPLARQLVSQFNSGTMIRFLEELTGIRGLVADPYLVGGGLHRIERGGFLDIHADFNRHEALDLDRRVNVLFYLNSEWQDDWGGQLELWNRSMTRCERRVSPILNRCVIFNTTDFSFHGHPVRVACPEGMARKSLAFYYYSNGRPQHERSPTHSTLYQTQRRVAVPSADRVRGALRRRVPSKVKSAVRAARRRVPGAASVEPGGSDTPAGDGRDNHWQRVVRTYEELATHGRCGRPSYTWSLIHVGDIARTLGIERFTAIEFGVAGGNGLLAMEDAADEVSRRFGVEVDVVGFDHGAGLPPPRDHRDAPYLMEAGEFAMDEARLRARLRRASLYLGLVQETLGEFLATTPAPVGFIAFDLDYYSSTVDAFRLFDQPPERFFPRVLCYFDDVLGYPWGDSNGERLAISEFNQSHDQRVIDHVPGLRYLAPPSEFHARWLECVYLAHILDHPRYAENEGVSLVTRLDLA